ncbi:helix-turn-helix domain-containing protein [Streptomyces tsukubensis]|uniref:helix-turn-helix domain-containing protein n=1 Tax=Streptomyces tsukubensis TaxID=83656 RepID=UPI00344D4324
MNGTDGARAAVIGRAVKSRRLRQGMSLRALADLSGLSVGYLSKVENGQRLLNRTSHITAVADALRVTPSELLTWSLPVSVRAGAAHEAVPAIRLLLMGLPLDPPGSDRPTDPVPEVMLAGRVREANRLYHAAAYDELAAGLPVLLDDLQQAAADATGPARERLLRLLADTYHPACALLLKALGYVDLAWMAVTRAAGVIAALDDPVRTASSGFFHAHILLAAGSPDQALARAQLSADQLQPHLGRGPAAQALLGELHLISSSALTQLGRRTGRGADDVLAHLAEAERLAAGTGESTAWHLNFGPANVGIHHVSLNAALGLHPEAVEAGQRVQPEQVATAGRRAVLHADLARSYAHLPRHHDQAVQHLLSAETAAPQRIHADAVARDTAAHLLGRSRDAAARRALTGLARRMSLTV